MGAMKEKMVELQEEVSRAEFEAYVAHMEAAQGYEYKKILDEVLFLLKFGNKSAEEIIEEANGRINNVLNGKHI